MHCVDLGEMAFEGAFGLHSESWELLRSLSRDIPHFKADGQPLRARLVQCKPGKKQKRNMRYLQVVSARSSFLRFILSFNASASRRAICIFCCIDSAFASAMPSGQSLRRQC